MDKVQTRGGLVALLGALFLTAACSGGTTLPPANPASSSTTSGPSAPSTTATTTTAPTTTTTTTTAPAPSSTAAPDDRIPVIWDDDGSPDGLIALLYLLRHPEVRIRAITVSCGEAHPQVFAENLVRMLTLIGRTGIPVAAGRDAPLSGDNAFPEPWRAATDDFWEIVLPETTEEIDPRGAARLIVDVVNGSPEPVTIFLTGNHTNLAEALRIDPSIATNIAHVEVMGGALFVPGNIASDWPDIANEVAEWNIWVDPQAAAEVLDAGLPVTLVPLDATDRVVWTEEDAAGWTDAGTSEGAVAAEILRWMLRSWFPTGVYAWDVVAAVDMIHDDVCRHRPHHVQVVTDPGDQEGRTIVVDGEPSNVDVCISPWPRILKHRVADVFAGP